jgi:Beta-xylosidase
MRIITFGTGGKYPEGPHLYKINGEYYLMIAEGGTEYGHMETIFRSNKLWGSYESCPYNPIISHRNAMGNPIQAIGHADLIEDQNGHWWLVCLGIRPLSGRLLHNLGRETFLVPVIWGEDGWPLVGDGGLVHETMEGPLPGPAPFCESLDFEDNFSSGRFKVEWNFVRNPRKENYSIGNNRLMLQAGPESLSDARPTFLGVRQKNIKASARTRVMIEPLIGAIAGITTYYNTKYHYELSICQDAEGAYIRLSATVHGMECMILNERIPLVGPVELLVKTDDDFYTFYYRIKDDWIMAGKVVTAGLCTESTATMTFTGVYLGVFASNATAQFDYFTVKNSI